MQILTYNCSMDTTDQCYFSSYMTFIWYQVIGNPLEFEDDQLLKIVRFYF